MEPVNDRFWSVNQDTLLQQLGTSYAGLASADAAERLQLYGPNRIKTKKRSGAFILFVNQFRSPLVLILLGAAFLAFVTSDDTDGLIITSIVLLSSIIGFWEEHVSTNAVEKLLSIISVTAEVSRDGAKVEIPLEGVVPGDIAILNAGDIVPGDCIILESKDLFVNEAALTGETLPDDKRSGVVDPDTQLSKRANMVFMGTSVTSGTARVVVVNTGLRTEFGKVAERLSVKEPKTEFERGMDKFGSMLMQLALLFVLAIFALNVYFERPILDSFLFALALAVGITPELLPAITSITLAHGAKQMAEKKVIVKKLNSIENFGSMNILCSDKTGTITEGIMHVHSAVGPTGNDSERVLLYAYLNAALQGGYENPVDTAIINHKSFSLERYTKIDEIPYDFVRKRLSILVTDGPRKLMISKGAVLGLLDVCSFAELEEGVAVDIEELRGTINELYTKLSGQGFRTLGLAYKFVDEPSIDRSMEKDMRFLGFVVLEDPLKQDAKETIRALHSLNVDFKIITGDNQLIAASVGAQVGWDSPKILVGTKIRQMSEEALVSQAAVTNIFAEIEPNQKERIILALRKAGNVVGYIGDGINDASAIHAADVGISVDGAVDVAKEAAEIVLLERDLSVLVKGISLGRETFANTIKYISFTISANFGNMISMAGASLLFWFLPLLPKQILAINLLTDIPLTTISTDSVDSELVERPRRWNISFIKRFMVVFGLQSTLFDFVTFGVLLLVLSSTVDQFRTGWFTFSIATEIIVVLVIRTRRFFLRSRPSKYLLLSSAIMLAVVIVLPYSPIAELLGLVILPVWNNISLIGLIVAYIITAEMTKLLFYRQDMSKPSMQ
ncbi:MAG: magnesium-translocating P-type ATPase [Candidatus Thorarchaeota archaeon]|nr:MAG: magnesium-translocating P-type ATPase [Candidatus Thorarchaeota archaeon]